MLKKVIIYSVQLLSWIFGKLLWKIVLDFEVIGPKKLLNLKKEGVVFIANHHRYLDPFLIGTTLPWRYCHHNGSVRFYTYHSFLNEKFYGLYLRGLGCYPAYPSGGDLKKALAETITLLENKHPIIFFPTGGKQKVFDAHGARPGIAYLAKVCDPLIIPVKIEYLGKTKLYQIKVRISYGEPFRYKEILPKGTDIDNLINLAFLITNQINFV